MVGKSDFNEIPAISPDLDLDFGLRPRVCQFYFKGVLWGYGGRGKGRYLFKINPQVGWDHSVRHIG